LATRPMSRDPETRVGSGAREDTEALLSELVSRAAARPVPGDEREPQSEEIVFDAEVGGVRYLLVRLPRVTRGAAVLSPREQEIVRMVAKGHPNKAIAGVLNISSWTVCTHLRRIFAKLGVTSRAAMVARLAEKGLIREALPRVPLEDEILERKDKALSSIRRAG
jgi:two-component system, NarL family, nitrate/nitrite response regulator NarL